jgi:hypothetical protein
MLPGEGNLDFGSNYQRERKVSLGLTFSDRDHGPRGGLETSGARRQRGCFKTCRAAALKAACGRRGRLRLLTVALGVHDYRQEANRHLDQMFGPMKHVAGKGQCIAWFQPVSIATVPVGNLPL